MTDLVQYDYSSKVVVITGGSRGLGHAMALEFARCGADVAIASRKLDSCEAAVREVRAMGRDGSAHAIHVGKWKDCERLCEEVYTRWGRCDVLINNAGLSPLYPSLLEHDEELFDKVIAVNLKGPFRLAALVGTRMAAGSGGSIINISSAGAVHPRPHLLPYAAAKAGLNALTIGLAHTFGPSVRCNAIMAGTFLTDVSKSWDMSAFAKRAEGFAARRGGQPDEIVGAAIYLASDASSYTTGTVLTVDGGQP